MKFKHDIYGLLAEFNTPEELLAAAEKVRDAGYKRTDAYSPFPVHGMTEALGVPKTRVPLFVLLGGMGGSLTGFFMQLYACALSYPLNIAGRPLNSWPAFIPVTFELTILCASLAAVFGMLALNRLPQPHHPIFNAHRFTHASADRFFVCIQARDKKFHLANTARFLQGLAAHHVSEVHDD